VETKLARPVNEGYVLGHSSKEIERLQKQNLFIEDFTWRCLRDAGIKPGMKVLEVGCGAGDVSLMLAELVGPEGQVVGVDFNQPVLETARERARAAGFNNLVFKQGDIHEIALAYDFEAVVGRLILFHLKNPAETLRYLLNHLVPGGLIVFQDYDLCAAAAYPPSQLFDQTLGRIIEAFKRGGADPQIGLKLGEIFREAGLPRPEMRCEASISAGEDWAGYEQLALVTRTMLPLFEKLGMATAAEVDVDTLADRLRADIGSRGGTGRGPDLVSAWTTKSS
jgi:ubiquinone/menaquinone biosynthesis C-methylase UbiE